MRAGSTQTTAHLVKNIDYLEDVYNTKNQGNKKQLVFSRVQKQTPLANRKNMDLHVVTGLSKGEAYESED